MVGFSIAKAGLAAVTSLFAAQTVVADQPFFRNYKAYQDGDLGARPQQQFHSAPNIRAPIYQVNKFDVDRVETDDEYIFMCGNYGGWGPMIVSSKDLSLVWSNSVYGGLAQMARSWDNFQGQRVMTVYVDGAVRVFDQNYKELYAMSPKGDFEGLFPDSHEAMLTADDTFLMVIAPGETMDLTSVGGPEDGKITNCYAQEVDPETNEVLWQFSTLDYFSIEDSFWYYNQSHVDHWDFCHMNSAEKTPEGHFLLSIRHLHTVFLVHGKTREVIWVMGGKKNMFKDISTDGKHADFHWQHEPRVSGPNRFTLFDNHGLDNGFCKEQPCSRGLELEYDDVAMTVKVVNEWYHPLGLYSASRGGVQRTTNGNVLVAWGQNPMYTEYTADGELVMDIMRGQVMPIVHGIYDIISYRAFKGAWDANPPWNPQVACIGERNDKRIFVSWNGATKVDQWALLFGSDENELDGRHGVAAWTKRQGFESEFIVAQGINTFARVAAIDKNGEILGATPVVEIASGKLIDVEYPVLTVGNLQTPELPDNSPPPHDDEHDATDGDDTGLPIGQDQDQDQDHDHDMGHDHDTAPVDDGNHITDIASPFVVGLGGIVFLCLSLSLAMFFCRCRGGQRLRGAKDGTAYGLLNSEEAHEVDPESFADDKDGDDDEDDRNKRRY